METQYFDESRVWNVDENANRESFDEVRDSAVSIFEFPRQRRSPFRAVSDFLDMIEMML